MFTRITKNPDAKILYRYHDYPGSYGRYVQLEEYEVIRETPKGYWIDRDYGTERWVSATGKKRFAYPTREEALRSFKARKEKQIEILTRQLDGAKSALQAVESLAMRSEVGHHVLSDEDFDNVVEHLQDTSGPSDAVKAAAQKYREMNGDSK